MSDSKKYKEAAKKSLFKRKAIEKQDKDKKKGKPSLWKQLCRK